MSETLTYEPEVKEGFSEEELDSLEVGESLEKEQEQLLAGKYENAEQLEKAYLELQTKLGEPKSDDEPAEETEAVSKEPEEKEEPEVEPEKEISNEDNILARLWDQKDKGFEQETLKELAETSPGDLAKMYILYRDKAVKDSSTNKGPRMTQTDVDTLKTMVGGSRQYTDLMVWAQANLDPAEVKRYDAVMERGDPDAAYFAVQALNTKYIDTVGQDGNLLTGKPSPAPKDVFRSQAELVSAMSNPKYDNDPAYRQDIMAKLERSKDVNF